MPRAFRLPRVALRSGIGPRTRLAQTCAVESWLNIAALLLGRSGKLGGMHDPDLRGGHVIAIALPTLRWATDRMMATLGPETLKRLKVNAGEHLAAILTAAFLHTPPSAIDTAGGADLWFDLSSSPRKSILGDGAVSAAFEIKSMPGPSRRLNSSIDYDRPRGIDTIGRSVTIRVQAASDVLREMGPVLRNAADQLLRKTSAESSRNIFVVIHLFDHLASECMQPILGPLLDPLPEIDGIDTIWVLWPLEHLTVWSSEQRAWTDLIFSAIDPESGIASDEMDPLQDAEDYFLTQVGHEGGSPYLFRLSAAEGAGTGEERTPPP
jgi:hypothetical protein